MKPRSLWSVSYTHLLKVDGVLLTLVDGRTNLARQTADTLRQSYGSVLKIYRSEIPVEMCIRDRCPATIS